MIVGNTIGAILKNPETIILRTEEGEEYAAAMTNEEVVLTATVNDVRVGKTAALQSGVKTGEKVIPAYHTYQGTRLVTDGSIVTLPNMDSIVDNYDYTKLQVIFCIWNTSSSDSVSTEKVAIDDNVYDVQSVTPIASITKDHEEKTINFGIVNDSGSTIVLRYFTYKEII